MEIIDDMIEFIIIYAIPIGFFIWFFILLSRISKTNEKMVGLMTEIIEEIKKTKKE